jgi:RNA polymerase sigma-70 factor (ECF subfamily)
MTTSATGDAEFSVLFGQYNKRIYRYVLSLVRDPSETEDIVQETFVRAYKKLPTLNDRARFSPWLYRIATNLCYDHYRHTASRAHPRLEADGDQPEQLADRETPRLDKVFEQKEMSACVQEYVETLSDAYRAVILLHDIEGLTNPEIAEMLGCSLATAKIRLHRARQRLKGALARACQFSRDERGVTVCERKSTPQGGDCN